MTSPQAQECGCGFSWDRKGNVKDIVFCPLHSAAGEMLKSIKDLLSYADSTPITIQDQAAKLISRAEGGK